LEAWDDRPVRVVSSGLTACLAVAGLLAASGVAHATPTGFLGVYGEDAPGSPDRAALVAAAQRAAGASVVRLRFRWADMQPARGQLDFSQSDVEVGAAALAGLDVLPFVVDAPAFVALPVPDGYVRRPANPAELGGFFTALVRRYGPTGSYWAQHPGLTPRPIRAWQVWNEPNLVKDWYPAPAPAAYAALLHAAADAIHGADPGAEVVAAGLPDSNNGMPFEEYLDGLYAAGAQRSFDAFALNAYAPSAQATIDLVHYVRGLLDAHGDAGRPLDVTEFGWPSAGPVSWLTTSEAGQAENIGAVIRVLGAEREQLGLERLLYFSWRDRPVLAGSRDLWPYYTGLLRTDASAKPALAAFIGAAAALDAPAGSTAAADAGAAGSESGARVVFDHRPRVTVLGSRRRRAAQGWRIQVRCRAHCRVRLRAQVPRHGTAATARIALSHPGIRTLRVRLRKPPRTRVRVTLEVADATRVPLRVVGRIKLVLLPDRYRPRHAGP
jgi:hypothetical protein